MLQFHCSLSLCWQHGLIQCISNLRCMQCVWSLWAVFPFVSADNGDCKVSLTQRLWKVAAVTENKQKVLKFMVKLSTHSLNLHSEWSIILDTCYCQLKQLIYFWDFYVPQCKFLFVRMFVVWNLSLISPSLRGYSECCFAVKRLSKNDFFKNYRF